MVMNIPALKNGEKDIFIRDIQGVVRAAAAAGGAKVKVIIEAILLTQDEKRRACEWVADAGAAYVKTSTAYAEGGATLEDVRLMYAAVKGRCLVKAAGGIREIHEVIEYLEAGARRFGSTRTAQFVSAYEDLPESDRARFGPYLRDIEGPALR
jgi:deoxyribose-phosphate aldolase